MARPARASRSRTWIAPAIAAIALLAPHHARATPPEYATFGRAQQIDHDPEPDRLLRIWVADVEQGDGILIQLPPALGGGPDGPHEEAEFTDVLIDGGGAMRDPTDLMQRFLETLYPVSDQVIEFAVITHHDRDHVAGLTTILQESGFVFDRVVHSGLASYRGGVRGLPATGNFDGVYRKKSDRIDRCLGPFIEHADGHRTIDDAFIIDDIDELRSEAEAGHLHKIYEDLATAIIASNDRAEITSFDRVHAPRTLLAFDEPDIPELALRVVWPLEELETYHGKSWSHTINGNSVTLRLDYGEFSMLLTGDHNDASERRWLDSLGDDRSVLVCDVMKVPHHGSRHNDEEFFRPMGTTAAVVSVASMGDAGFGTGFKHPHQDVVGWCGRSHRFYSTHIHERRFDWTTLTPADEAEMVEKSHILIETDGTLFRIVEIPTDGFDPTSIPSVRSTRRGNGTRWIDARDGDG